MNDAGDLFSYHWMFDGQPAVFRVDVDCAESFDALGDFTTLLTVSCRPLDGDAERFTAREERKLPGAFARCRSALGEKSLSIGSIELPAARYSYFYVSDARLLVPLMNTCEKNGSFRMECTKASEPDRETYFHLLYPDRAKRQSADNARYIRALAARGDNSAALRRINLHMCFPSGQGRAAFASDARSMGFAVGLADYVPEQALPYTLVLHVVGALLEPGVTALTTKAIYAAEAYGGTLFELDSAFVPKRSWL